MANLSVKALTELFGDNASAARAIMRGTLDPCDVPGVVEPAWVNVPSVQVLRMRALGILGEFFGVENVYDVIGRQRFTYLNAGDVYASTVIFNPETGTYSISTVGDRVEALERRGVRF